MNDKLEGLAAFVAPPKGTSGAPPKGTGGAHRPEARAFRDQVALQAAVALVTTGRFSNVMGGEERAIASFAFTLANRMEAYRK